jgi:hypothetical protein
MRGYDEWDDTPLRKVQALVMVGFREMQGFKEVEVGSVGELIEKGTPDQPDRASGRRRNYSVYRGGTDARRGLVTSLDCLGGCEPPHTKAHLEEHILRNFRRYAQPFLKQPINEWELLVTAQHHGLPTRLLDWTYSPLVAAHFATLPEEKPGDRVIWKLDWRRLHGFFGLKPLAFLVSDLDEALKQKGYQSAWDLFGTDGDGKELFVCMLEPPGLDARILAQSAAFTLSSVKTRSFDSILRECGLSDSLTRFVIPAEKVRLIRDQLDLCSIDERSLFPDLDGIAAEIKRYYSAGPEEEGNRKA